MPKGKLKIIEIEEFIKFHASSTKKELNKIKPEYKHKIVNALKPKNLLERYNKDPEFKALMDQKQYDKIYSIFKIRSANGTKMNDNLSTEDRYNNSKKGHETLGPEGRSARAASINETLGPEGRAARAAVGKETLGPEGRSAVSFKRAETLGESGLSKSAKKTVNTCKEKYGDDHYVSLAKENNKKTQKTVSDRVEKSYKLVLSKLPKYFTSKQVENLVKSPLFKDKIKPSLRHILNSELVSKNKGMYVDGKAQIQIHENLHRYNVINNIDDFKKEVDRKIALKKEEFEKTRPRTKLEKKQAKYIEFLNILPEKNITYEMAVQATLEVGYAKRQTGRILEETCKLQKIVRDKTGRIRWSKCTYKKF